MGDVLNKGAAGELGGGVPQLGEEVADAGASQGEINDPTLAQKHEPLAGVAQSGVSKGKLQEANSDISNGRFTQKDIDRAVEEARRQWTAEQDEAARLSKLSKDEREREKLRLDREKFEKEKTEFAHKQLELETARQLTERRLPASMAARICGKNAEETKANIDAFEMEWNEALKMAVNDRLKSTPPRVPGIHNNGRESMMDIIEASIKKGF